MNNGSGFGASLLLFIILFPIISLILLFGELMVIRKGQKKIIELLKRLDPNRRSGIELDDDDAI